MTTGEWPSPYGARGHLVVRPDFVAPMRLFACTPKLLLRRCYNNVASSCEVLYTYIKFSATSVALEQAQTFIAKGKTLTLEEFDYAPES